MRSLLALASAAVLVATAPTAAQAVCTGEYDINVTQIGLHAGVAGAACGASSHVGTSWSARQGLDDGFLPDDIFAAEMAAWERTVAAWTWVDAATQAGIVADVWDAYDQLHTTVDRFLECLPDRLVIVDQSWVTWFGWLRIGVQLIDDDCGQTLYRSVWTSRWGCPIEGLELLGGDSASGNNWFAAALGLSHVWFRPHGGWGGWSTDAAFAGGGMVNQCPVVLTANVGIDGQFTLTPSAP